MDLPEGGKTRKLRVEVVEVFTCLLRESGVLICSLVLLKAVAEDNV
jgi:hypothetical protein